MRVWTRTAGRPLTDPAVFLLKFHSKYIRIKIKSQVKMNSSAQKTDRSSVNFQSNIKYLFKLLKQNNNLKKVDFTRETRIKRSAIYKWENIGSIPTETNLEIIKNYFNKHLSLALVVGDILYKNLELLSIDTIKENIHIYLTEHEKERILNIRKLNNGQKELLDAIIREFIK